MEIICSWNIANTFLKRAFEEKLYFTKYKLNYLIYLLYSHYLYNTGQKLFSEIFIKTNEGPVLVNIESKFGGFNNNVITKYARDSKGNIYGIDGDTLKVSLDYIWNLYKYISDDELLNFLNNNYSFSNKRDDEIITDIDILENEIRINEKLLEKAKGYRKNLQRNNI